VKILPVNLFRKLVPAFQEPPVTLKVVPKAACDLKIVPKADHECTLEKMY
jgi:hypothetical protein